MLAALSTIVFIAVVCYVVLTSPGWPRVRERFLSGEHFADAWPDVVDGFWLNVRMFLIAEPLILLAALTIASFRSLPGPVFLPIRAVTVAYVDLIRGLPVVLVIFLVGFGVPGLQLDGLPNDPLVLGMVALVVCYSAYVSEVFRAGIQSVAPTQRAAARSLGLTHGQTMRYVVLPQAIRNVVPPLLNDFISLQKDTALVSMLGPLEALRQAQIYSSRSFNFTSYLVAALLFVALTIPLARFTDWIAARTERRRRSEGTV